MGIRVMAKTYGADRAELTEPWPKNVRQSFCASRHWHDSKSDCRRSRGLHAVFISFSEDALVPSLLALSPFISNIPPSP